MAIDPITASTTFATLVSLISDFREKRKEISENDYEEFLEWLSENRHNEIKSIVEQNQTTIVSLKAILNTKYALISEKLQQVDNKLASILSSDNLFSALVRSINPEQSLSKQALNILTQFHASGASKILLYHSLEGVQYFFMDGDRQQVNVDELRFLEDDLESLVELNLLRKDSNSDGDIIFKYTRAASEVVVGMKML